MKTWKWAALTLAGGVLLQFSTCSSDFAYYLMQALANQLVTLALNAATGTTTAV